MAGLGAARQGPARQGGAAQGKENTLLGDTMKHVFIGSDTHCGALTGLTPPSYQIETRIGSSSLFKFERARKVLWKWFDREIKTTLDALKIAEFDSAKWNGDLVEGKGSRSGGTELLTADRNVQVAIAKDVVARVPAKQRWFTYGTPYHGGDDDDWEYQVADFFGAKIEGEGHYDINGLQMSMKHHIGNTSSAASRFTALSNAQVKQMLWSERKQQPRANLIVRSHVHCCKNVGEPAVNFQGWTTPGLQGLGTKFGIRRVDGLPIDFGFLVLSVKDASEWCVSAHIAPLTLQRADVVTI